MYDVDFMLHEIQDASEQSLESLIDHVKEFKISSAQGEDINEAVSLVKSTHRVLTNASRVVVVALSPMSCWI